MDLLPYDLIMKITLEIDPLGLINLALLSRKFRRLGNDENLFRKLLSKIFLEFKSGLPHWKFEPFPTFKETFIRMYRIYREISTKIHQTYGLEYSKHISSETIRMLEAGFIVSKDIMYTNNITQRLKYTKSEHVLKVKIERITRPIHYTCFLHEGICFKDGEKYKLMYPETHIALLFEEMENEIYTKHLNKIILAKDFIEKPVGLVYQISHPGAFFSRLNPYLTLIRAEFILLDLDITNKPFTRDNCSINFRVIRIPKFGNWKMAQEDELDTLNEEKVKRESKRNCLIKVQVKGENVYLKDLFDYYDRMKDNYPEKIEIGMKFYGKNGLKDDTVILSLDKIVI